MNCKAGLGGMGAACPEIGRSTMAESFANVGIDPGKYKGMAAVVDEHGKTASGPLRFCPTCEGIARLLSGVSNCAPGVELRFYIEACGWLWYAPAAILQELGYKVYLVNPAYTKAQRKMSSPGAKSDFRDAQALARAPFNMGDRAEHIADVPVGIRLNLQNLCRHRLSLRQDATAIQLRLIAWLGLTSPGLTAIIGTDLSEMDQSIIAQYPVISEMAGQDEETVQAFLTECANGRAVDPALAQELMGLAAEAYTPRDLDPKCIAIQVEIELARLELLQQQIARLDREIASLLKLCDPHGYAQTLPGFGPVIAAILVAEAGVDVSRFEDAAHFASWTGMVARAFGSSGKHVQGLPMTKAGRSDVKWALYMAAKTASTRDPLLKDFYDRLRADGKCHQEALVAVGHKLARWYWAIMNEQRPFERREPETQQPLAEPTPSEAENQQSVCA